MRLASMVACALVLAGCTGDDPLETTDDSQTVGEASDFDSASVPDVNDDTLVDDTTIFADTGTSGDSSGDAADASGDAADASGDAADASDSSGDAADAIDSSGDAAATDSSGDAADAIDSSGDANSGDADGATDGRLPDVAIDLGAADLGLDG